MEFESPIIETLKTVSRAFNRNHLPYCIAGGWAVSIWSRPRATEDIDLLILPDQHSHDDILAILRESMEIIVSHPEPMRFKHIRIWRTVVRLSKEGEETVLDFLLADQEYLKVTIDRRITINFQGIDLPLISIDDLIIVKMMANRAQDRIDIDTLLDSGQKIDFQYIKAAIDTYALPVDAQQYPAIMAR